MNTNQAECCVEYREVPGFPGYRVGDDGSVWSNWNKGKRKRDVKWRRMVLYAPTKKHYFKVTLVGDDSRVYWSVHRIVLTSFVGPRPEGMVTRHLDGNHHNNALSNLVYGTQSENGKDTIRHGVYHPPRFLGEDHPSHILTEKKVVEIRKAYDNKTRKYGALVKIGKMYGVSSHVIGCVVRGETWKHVKS